MTNVVLALPVLGLFLLQTPDQGKQPREQSLPVDLSPAAPQATPPTVPGEKPFGKLFEPAEERAARQALASQKPAPKVVCGMVVIQADPNVDPRFIIRAPADTTAYKIRRIPPTACAD
jgi:hypothetical protein